MNKLRPRLQVTTTICLIAVLLRAPNPALAAATAKIVAPPPAYSLFTSPTFLAELKRTRAINLANAMAHLKSQSAADTYHAAELIECFLPGDPPMSWVYGPEPAAHPSQHELRERARNAATYVRINARMFALIHVGVKQQYFTPAMFARLTGEKWDRVYSFAECREVARARAIESDCKLARGDVRGALESAIDITKMGYQIRYGTGIMGALGCRSLFSIGRHCVGLCLPHLDATLSRDTARRLFAMENARAPFFAMLANEKVIARHEIWAGRPSEGLFTDWPPADSPGKRIAAVMDRFADRMMNYPLMLRDNDKYLDALIVMARKPYSRRHWLVPPRSTAFEPYIGQTVDNQNNVWFQDTRGSVHNMLLIETLALRAFKLTNGHYPATAAELVPSILPALPPDAFGQNKPLKYRRTTTGYLLYSIGPDGIDGGGKPAPRRKSPSGQYILEPYDAKGDIVAGSGTWP